MARMVPSTKHSVLANAGVDPRGIPSLLSTPGFRLPVSNCPTSH